MDEQRTCDRFVTSYDWDGKVWTLYLYAYDWEDAKARCNALGRLRLDGKFAMSLPVAPAAAPTVGLFVRAGCWLRNLFSHCSA